jgi:HEAT repeat protein
LANSTSAVADEIKFLGRTGEEWLSRLDDADDISLSAWALAQMAEQQPPMIARLIHHRNPVPRYWGMQAAGRIAVSKETYKTILQTGLRDPTPSVRIAAAEWLSLSGDAEAALPVLIAAMSDPQDAVRIQAVAALERLGEAARPAEATLRTATSDSSEYVKRISARALQKLDATKK